MITLPTIALLLSQPATPDSLPWWDGIPLGSHRAGFESFEHSRLHGNTPRRIHIRVWYPTPGTGGTVLRFGDLWRLASEEALDADERSTPLPLALSLAATGDSAGLSTSKVERALRSSLLSRRGVPPGNQPFPLVVWGSRHGTVAAQSVLAEVLASHGYVVATAWSADPPLAMLWEDRPTADKLATIDAQSDDLRATIAEVARRFRADTSRIALLAWSYGGQTVARVQEAVPGVRVVVSLDANVIPEREEEQLRLRVPLVALFQRDTTRRGFEKLEQLAVPALVIRFPALAHGNMNLLEGYLPGLLDAGTVLRWSRGGAVAVEGYRVVSRIAIAAVRGFLAADRRPPQAVLESLRDLALSESLPATLYGGSGG